MMKSTMLLRALFASAILLAGASSSSSSSVLDASAAVDGNNYDVDQIDQGLFSTLFEEWMTTHNKEYVSIEERSLRFMIWLENHALIETHNTKEVTTFTLGHNEYSDMTHAEFRERMGLGEFAIGLDMKQIMKRQDYNFMNFEEDKQKMKEEENDVANNLLLLRGSNMEPSTAAMTERRHLLSTTEEEEEGEEEDLGCDWHTKGLLGPIRQQGQCGACWAFSAIGAIESAMAINKFNSMPPIDRDKSLMLGLVTPLSEQDLIDCDKKFEKGCKGGLMTTTFNEEEKSGRGICSEADYPYLETQGTCSNDLCTPVEGSIVKDQVDVVPRKTHALEKAVKVQPVTAAMVANDPMFQFYSKGIYQMDGCGRVTKQMGDPDCGILYDKQDVCIPDINHGVLVVGFGVEESATSSIKKFFKVKNSWGSSWGEGGFFRIARYDEDKTDPMNNWGECAILTLLSYPVMK